MTPPTRRRRRRRLDPPPASDISSSSAIVFSLWWFAAVAIVVVFVIPSSPRGGCPGGGMTHLSVAGSTNRPPPPPLAAFRHPAPSSSRNTSRRRPRSPPVVVVRGDDGSGIDLQAAAAVTPSAAGGAFDAYGYDGGWDIVGKIARALGINDMHSEKSSSSTSHSSNYPDEGGGGRGTVTRTAVRPHQTTSGGSVPSSRFDTTRKSAVPALLVSENGAAGDYNHYRTLALRSTPDRAISILMGDVGSYVRSLDGGYFADDGDGNDADDTDADADADADKAVGDSHRRGYRDGDLGENILVDGVYFDYFEVGMRYRFFSSSSSSKGGDGGGASADATMLTAGTTTEDDVVVEITEPMVPCANLCKLPYINDPTLEPRHQLARCQYFLEALGQKGGLRGWYVRVVKGGMVRVGDSLSADFVPTA